MKRILLIAIAAFALVGANAARAVPVDLELALLVDVSGSVNSTEYNLQKTGYINAFNNATIQNLIAGLPGGIAVTYVEWSGASQQSQLVGWSQITDATSSSAFASAISSTSRAFSGQTAPGSAVNYAVPLFSNNGYEGSRWVIDVSGDGTQNDGTNTPTARNNALTAGVDTINGLPIGSTGLTTWYQNNIVGGTGSFLIAASSFSDFQNAVYQKLYREIHGGDVPEPSSLGMLGFGLMTLVGFVALRRRML
ncbi:MAG: DUF1194 domain-containing protein [Acidihalobacter sp.]